jgi:UDP-N-acetyl-D-mannosaminuronate dehydrogenase
MTNYSESLLSKIYSHQSKIAVIGLPLAVAFAQAGFSTIGLDLDRGILTD